MKDLRSLIREDEYEARMKQARERAQWELGDPTWAAVIVGAFLFPAEDREALLADRSEGR